MARGEYRIGDDRVMRRLPSWWGRSREEWERLSDREKRQWWQYQQYYQHYPQGYYQQPYQQGYYQQGYYQPYQQPYYPGWHWVPGYYGRPGHWERVRA